MTGVCKQDGRVPLDDEDVKQIQSCLEDFVTFVGTGQLPSHFFYTFSVVVLERLVELCAVSSGRLEELVSQGVGGHVDDENASDGVSAS